MAANIQYAKKIEKTANYRFDIASPIAKTVHSNQIVKLAKFAPLPDTLRNMLAAIASFSRKSKRQAGNHCNEWTCYPSVQKLADIINVTRVHAHRLLNELEKQGLIARIHRYKLSRRDGRVKQDTNLYVIGLKKIKALVRKAAASCECYTRKLHKQSFKRHQQQTTTATPESAAFAASKVDRSPADPAAHIETRKICTPEESQNHLARLRSLLSSSRK